MTQATSPLTPTRGSYTAQNLATTCAGTGNTVLLDMTVLGLDRLSVVVLPTVHAIDVFLVEVKLHPSTDWVTLTSAVTATPAGLVIAASGTLASLGAAAVGWVVLDVRGIYGVRISVSGASDGTLLDAYATGS
jgi:hypothetical protein